MLVACVLRCVHSAVAGDWCPEGKDQNSQVLDSVSVTRSRFFVVLYSTCQPAVLQTLRCSAAWKVEHWHLLAEADTGRQQSHQRTLLLLPWWRAAGSVVCWSAPPQAVSVVAPCHEQAVLTEAWWTVHHLKVKESTCHWIMYNESVQVLTVTVRSVNMY